MAIWSRDVETFRLIATGIIDGIEASRKSGSLPIPYPPALQRGLNRLAATCLLKEERAPIGVPELLRWCRNRGLDEWPLDLTSLGVTPADRLLVGSTATALCFELAEDSNPAEFGLAESNYIVELLRVCRELESPAMYSRVRRLLIENPVLVPLDLHLKGAELGSVDLRHLLLAGYRPTPLETRDSQGWRAACVGCRNLLVRAEHGNMRCLELGCRRFKEGKARARFDPKTELLELQPWLRRFVQVPGLSELRIARSLERAGSVVELWPAFDAYDLRVTHPDGQVWAIEVKAWVSPYLLASQVQPIASEPRWDRALMVIPDAIASGRGGYLVMLRRLLSERSDWNADIVSERELRGLAVGEWKFHRA
jgi:hypothetical protein